MKRATGLRSWVIAIGCFAMPLLGGCSNQGEGQPCDHNSDNNGNDDCESGLVCVPAQQLNRASDLCCPPPGSARISQCFSGPPPETDASSDEAATREAGTSNEAEASSREEASDAPTEADGGQDEESAADGTLSSDASDASADADASVGPDASDGADVSTDGVGDAPLEGG